MAASLTASGLDDRVTDDGRPVPRIRLVRGWFTIQRPADSADQVELVTRIPGYLTEVTRHACQAGAEQAARNIYAAYCSDCRSLTVSEQETER